jgi:hypothetical protein
LPLQLLARQRERQIVRGTKTDETARLADGDTGLGLLGATAVPATVPGEQMFKTARDFAAWIKGKKSKAASAKLRQFLSDAKVAQNDIRLPRSNSVAFRPSRTLSRYDSGCSNLQWRSIRRLRWTWPRGAGSARTD